MFLLAGKFRLTPLTENAPRTAHRGLVFAPDLGVVFIPVAFRKALPSNSCMPFKFLCWHYNILSYLFKLRLKLFKFWLKSFKLRLDLFKFCRKSFKFGLDLFKFWPKSFKLRLYLFKFCLKSFK